MSLKGIDISNWQAGLDIGKVMCDFVIVKATEGLTIVDKSCDKFYQQAKRLGKKLGFYHYAHPENNSATAEAQFFYNNTKNYFGEAIPILDWESSGRANIGWALEWLKTVEKLSGGVKPMIYMNQSTCQEYNWSPVVANDNGLWIAKYRDMVPDYNHDMSNAGSKPAIKHWPFYAMWQWTSTGRLDGYGGDLDCNEFYGDKATWDKYAARRTTESAGSASAPSANGTEVNIGNGLPYTAAMMINQAKAWVGLNELDNSHRPIVDLYNSCKPLPGGYKLSYTDPWCAGFIGALAVKCGATDIIPMSASVPSMVSQARMMGIWQGAKDYTPSPGDLVTYDWDGDNYPDHVGIVTTVDLANKVFQSIEGNMSDAVGIRTAKVGYKYIWGFITPKYVPEATGPQPDEDGQYQATIIFEDEPHTKTVDQLAQEVLDGKWGNGEDRRNRLTSCGYSYAAVQARVNAMVIDQVAKDVINGKYGNGWARRYNLQKAGYDYQTVQNRVNEMLR